MYTAILLIGEIGTRSHELFTPIDVIPEVVRGDAVLRLVNRSPEVSGIQELISSRAPGVFVQIPILLPVS